MKLVQGCLSARKDCESRFHHRGGVVKLVQVCLNARNDRESRLHHCGGLVRVGLLKCQEGSRKPFSQLWGSC